jgi:hypothetical protein
VIRKEHRVEVAELARQNEVVLAAVALRVAEAAAALLSGCTAAVVVAGIGSEWRMLAQSGPEDLSDTWRRLVAESTRVEEPDSARSRALVLGLASERISAKLVLAPLAAISLPQSARRIVQPLLDAGGVLLDAALFAETSPGRPGLRLVTGSRTDDQPAGDAPERFTTQARAGA